MSARIMYPFAAPRRIQAVAYISGRRWTGGRSPASPPSLTRRRTRCRIRRRAFKPIRLLIRIVATREKRRSALFCKHATLRGKVRWTLTALVSARPGSAFYGMRIIHGFPVATMACSANAFFPENCRRYAYRLVQGAARRGGENKGSSKRSQ